MRKIILIGLFCFFILYCEKQAKDNRIVSFWFLSLANNSASNIFASCEAATTDPTLDTVNGIARIQVTPSQACKSITQFNGPHQIYSPASTAKNILSIFYPGTGALASDYTLLLQRGAIRGYHVIGLNYPNSDSINAICNRPNAGGALSCFGDTREEILTGVDKSKFVSIDSNNSIEGRILALLKYLANKRPNENWDQFYSNNQINWSKIYVSGHSQGSGHAGYQGKLRNVSRVTLYSGISDFSVTQLTLPTWMSLPQVSLNGSYYGFIHANDTIANFSGNPNQVTDAWANPLGMSGDLTNVSIGAPYANSRRLFSTACNLLDDNNRHACPVYNGFQNVWDYISYP